ncbi:hypothetical protein PIB30_071019 [Stylosanthes scabra]|uniref:Uncharacterized protein n=1 Tax=Stylosanthes scabra TaxID=79078 RepID=A0ABU6XPY7_9FABA|nr:hypothetical protein [Stylosanthes scabra]
MGHINADQRLAMLECFHTWKECPEKTVKILDGLIHLAPHPDRTSLQNWHIVFPTNPFASGVSNELANYTPIRNACTIRESGSKFKFDKCGGYCCVAELDALPCGVGTGLLSSSLSPSMNSGSLSESLARNASSTRGSGSLSTTGTDTGCGGPLTPQKIWYPLSHQHNQLILPADQNQTFGTQLDAPLYRAGSQGETARQHWRNVDSERNHQNSQVDPASPQTALWSAPLGTAFYSETKQQIPISFYCETVIFHPLSHNRNRKVIIYHAKTLPSITTKLTLYATL